ncbi:unnamed protein product [Bursaphelenchus xylophilus]|uniref:(pine wood nematode) hypothetical protein n=1 Tax=Bursaphelenchus xylophilus TaxID=6326 RepID=A0A811KGD7_BURXY|nr:unnamed protein product [Bursaphelenchus xylophilus]CAG9096984.1 unnamed protein product [Bursaphelenchus xylophilus]
MSSGWCNRYFIYFLWVFFERSCGLQEISAKHLIPLNQYVNQWPGFLHDHIATTWTYSSHPNTLNSYYQLSVLGLVLKSVAAKECNCSVEVNQMVDEFMGIGGGPGRPGLLEVTPNVNVMFGQCAVSPATVKRAFKKIRPSHRNPEGKTRHASFANLP